jgi:hypothetical protein
VGSKKFKIKMLKRKDNNDQELATGSVFGCILDLHANISDVVERNRESNKRRAR